MDNRNGTWQIYVSKVSPYEITGPGNLCSSATYNVSGLPANATVTWSASPSGIVSLSPNGSQVTVTKISSGEVTLTANLSFPCSNSSTSVYRTIQLGPPIIVGGYYDYNGLQFPLQEDTGIFDPYNQVCYSPPSTVVTTDMDITMDTSVVWSKQYPSGTGLLWAQTGNNISIHFRTIQSGIFEIEAANACGTVSKRYSFEAVECSQFIVSPNPASNTITIRSTLTSASGSRDIKDTATRTSSANNVERIKVIRIYNTSGKLVKQQQFSNNSSQVQMDVSALTPGIYFVEISNGQHTETHKLVIGGNPTLTK